MCVLSKKTSCKWCFLLLFHFLIFMFSISFLFKRVCSSQNSTWCQHIHTLRYYRDFTYISCFVDPVFRLFPYFKSYSGITCSNNFKWFESSEVFEIGANETWNIYEVSVIIPFVTSGQKIAVCKEVENSECEKSCNEVLSVYLKGGTVTGEYVFSESLNAWKSENAGLVHSGLEILLFSWKKKIVKIFGQKFFSIMLKKQNSQPSLSQKHSFQTHWIFCTKSNATTEKCSSSPPKTTA